MAPMDEGGFRGQKDFKAPGGQMEQVGLLASLGFKETQDHK